MSKNAGQLALASLFQALARNIGFSTEGGELGYSSEEVVISVDRVSQWEAYEPVVFIEERHDSVHVVSRQVVASYVAINREGCRDTMVNQAVIRVWLPIDYANLDRLIVPIVARP